MSATATSSRRRPWAVVGVIALGVTAVALAGFVIAAAVTDDDKSQFSSQIEDSCREWMGSGSATGGNAEWCSDMAGWMEGHMPGGGMPSMMFGNSGSMADMCRQWMTASPPPGGDEIDGQRWCTGMANWMGGRMGSGPGPMNGPMMDG